MADAAVFVRNANKSYDRNNKVLCDFAMTVPKGSIYGLLGASGCGKTTLLNCIVGRLVLDSGELWVLGGKPGTVGSGVPGPRVGLMPQEVALCEEFTIKEALFFFGRVMGMTDNKIHSRLDELTRLLDLPKESKYVRDCSGGQQRRVSLACALVHNPELLILDEPTAGVDPVLRERIWNFLRHLTENDKTTVIITTHYIEETRTADMIGLMRGGQLIAEAPPLKLLRAFSAETLEDVFLLLSRKQEKARKSLPNISDGKACQSMGMYDMSPIDYGSNTDTFYQVHATRPTATPKNLQKQAALRMNKNRTLALLDKNWKQLYRNVSGLAFVLLLLPICCSLLFMVVVGSNVTNLNIAVVNLEGSCDDFFVNESAVPIGDHGLCNMKNLGCRFFDALSGNAVLNKFPFDTFEEAVEGVKKGLFKGAIVIPKNHSWSLETRMMMGRSAKDEVIDTSEIKVHLDMTDYIIGFSMQRELLKVFQTYMAGILNDCGYKDFLNPIKVVDIYGNAKSLTEDMVPGYFLTLISYIATMLTSQIIISERLSGIWNRSAVAGVTVLEIIFTHFLVQFAVMVVQVIEAFLVMFVFFDIPIAGSLWLIAFLGLLQGISGLFYGFLVSIATYDNYFTANVMISGGFYPMVLICGTVWPIEAQPRFLRWIAYCTPFALPAEAFRDIQKKAWDLSVISVAKGFGMEFVWIVILTVSCVYLLKNKQ